MKPRAGLFLAGAAALGAGVFALWPVKPRSVSVPTIDQAAPAKRTAPALDLAAFRTPIWVAEPPPLPPAAPAQAPPPPPPLKLQLLAIIRDSDNAYKAAVYDPETDKILVVATGERLGLRTVDRVDKSSLTLRDDTGRRTLALKEGGEP